MYAKFFRLLHTAELKASQLFVILHQGSVIFTAETVCRQVFHHVQHDTAQRHGGAHGVAGFNGVDHILDMQVQAETGFELPVHSGSQLAVQDLGTGISVVDRVINNLGFHAGLLAHGKGFSDGCNLNGDDMLVHQLRGVSGP